MLPLYFFVAALFFLTALLFCRALLYFRCFSFLSQLYFSRRFSVLSPSYFIFDALFFFLILLSPQSFCCHLNSRGNIKRRENNKVATKNMQRLGIAFLGFRLHLLCASLLERDSFSRFFKKIFFEVNFL